MKILIAGDLYPINRNKNPFIQGDKKAILNNLEETFDDVDYRIINLECCLSDDYVPKKIFDQHILPSSILNGLKAIKTDLVCLANNHINDYGSKGIEYTTSKLDEYGIPYTGLNDLRHYAIEKDGVSVGIINVACKENTRIQNDKWSINTPYDFELLEYTRILSEKFDHLVILSHEGMPSYALPFPKQKQMAHSLINAGAKCVVYQSSHTIGAVEKYNNGTIVYGQGNFIFDIGTTTYSNWNNGFLVQLTANKESLIYEHIPYTQSVHQGGIMRMNIEEEPKFNRYLSELSEITKDDKKVSSEWERYAEILGNKLFINLWVKQSRLKLWMSKLKIADRFLPQRSKSILLNYLECSHNNALMVEYLKKFNS